MVTLEEWTFINFLQCFRLLQYSKKLYIKKVYLFKFFLNTINFRFTKKLSKSKKMCLFEIKVFKRL